MTKCPSPSSRTACLISSLLSNYSYVDYNKRFISFATNEKVDALSRLLTISIVAEWCCRFSSNLILKIRIWNMLINLLYCIVLYCIVLYCIVLYCIVVSKDIEWINREFREEAIRKWVHRDLVPPRYQFSLQKSNSTTCQL